MKKNGKKADIKNNNGNSQPTNGTNGNNNINIDTKKKEKKIVNPKKADDNSDITNDKKIDAKPYIIVPDVVEEPLLVTGIKKGQAIVDHKLANASDYHVVADVSNAFNGKCFDCTLNQSDLKNNNNKFYIVQLLSLDKKPNSYFIWARWGRVGYDGQNSMKVEKI